MSNNQKQEYHNVSVRLTDTDYNKLVSLHEKLTRFSFGKVSHADVIRIALNELFLTESQDEKPVTKRDIEEAKDEVIETVKETIQEEIQEETESEPKGDSPKEESKDS